MADITLLTPGRLGLLETPNRIMMAPMTRARAHQNGVQSELAATYYSQRASAGLIATEGTSPSAVGMGYYRTPVLDTAEQVASWTPVTKAVHDKGGRIFMQFMHVGRIGHASNRYTSEPLVAPSAIRAAGQIRTAAGMQDFDMPRALDLAEIPKVVQEFADATKKAVAAGFDGVELHSASGYLPMQFLSSGSNKRTDAYGGSATNRIRFVVETLEAMIGAAGSAARVGIKISPGMPFNDAQDDDPVDTYTTLVKALAPMGLAYLHVLRSALPDTFEILRPHYPGTFAVGGAFDQASGNAALASGLADYVVFGKLFTSNPDLPARFAASAPLTPFDPNTFYAGEEKGYTDYPQMA